MNQCVPSWDMDENLVVSPKINLQSHSNSSLSNVPSLEYEVAELTWENGQIAMHGLGLPRVVNKPTASSSPTKYATWDKPRAGGTLESIVDQATSQPAPAPAQPQPKSAVDGGGDNANDLVPWFDYHRTMANPAASTSITMTMDALVPCNNNIPRSDYNQENSTRVLDPIPPSMVGCSTRVGSCSAAGGGPRVPRVGNGSCRTNGSASESATCGGGRDSHQVTLDTYEKDLGTGGAFTSASLVSLENTISSKENTKTTADDHDSVCHSRSQRDQAGDEDGKKKGTGKSSVSTKRSRAAAIHNQSERKRRDKINERMKTLQKLVPNSSKTDKASMLNEVIEYLKQLQAQVHMMSRMNIPSMMLPLAMQQQLQMSMMAPAMGMGMGMGMGVMDMNTISRAAGIPPVIPPASAFMPVPSWDNPGDCMSPPPPDPLSAFLACQSQPMNMEAYSRLAALYQQFQQAPGPGPGSGPGPSGTKN